jgi:aspartyl-tRNA(Asn)/glutamyl-tRNA(Gln) amidotransferase subunit A
MLDPSMLDVAAAYGSLPAEAMIEAEALRVQAAHAMARLHQRYDLVLCPTVPGVAPLTDAPVDNPAEALRKSWACWTFAFNLTRQPAMSVPMGVAANGLPRAVQLAAAMYRDDLVLRAARILEIAAAPGFPDFP